MGDDFNYMGSDGNLYAGDTPWHSDGWHTHYLHVKFAFYLDDIDGSSGALRVVPGSHHIDDQFAQQLQHNIRECDKVWGITGDQVPAVAFDITPGDLVLFNHNTKHAAYGGSGRRRMFTINCCQRYAEEDLQQLRNYLSSGARFWIDRAYGQTMVDTANPKRMRHLEQVMANDSHIAELACRARREMGEPSRG